MIQAMGRALRWGAGAVIGGLITAAMAALIPGAAEMMHVLPAMNVGFFGGYMILDGDRRTWARTLLISYALASALCGPLLFGANLIGVLTALYGVMASGFGAVMLRLFGRLRAGIVVVRPQEDDDE